MTAARRLALAGVLAAALAPAARATPVPTPTPFKETRAAARKLQHTDARTRVAVSTTPGHVGELQPARQAAQRNGPPLTAEEIAAQKLERLLHGSLAGGVTGLFVVDALTGAPLFAINADERLNPASNVKMISTATALEELGPDFRYSTRLLGPVPGPDLAIRQDVFLLGTYDPVLAAADLDDIAAGVVARGIVAVHGDLVIGSDGTRDGMLRPSVAIAVTAGAPNLPPRATAPDGFDLVRVVVQARTLPYPAAPRLTYTTSDAVDEHGRPRVVVTIGGTIGRGGAASLKIALSDRERGRAAAYALRAALRAHGVTVTGEVRTAELGDYLGDALGHGVLPIELARHESRTLASIVADVNKYSVNWLAERVAISAAALVDHAPATTEGAVTAMYGWLGRHAHLTPDDVVLDSGSGLSYRTQISARNLVAIVRDAGGLVPVDQGGVAPAVAQAWLGSLAIAGHDGTLANRFRTADVRGRVRGKTGTLSTAIALSGLVEIDPQHPLAFALVTNTNAPLAKASIRKTHEQLVTVLCKYAEARAATLAATHPSAPEHARAPVAPPPAAPPPAHVVHPDDEPEGEP